MPFLPNLYLPLSVLLLVAAVIFFAIPVAAVAVPCYDTVARRFAGLSACAPTAGGSASLGESCNLNLNLICTDGTVCRTGCTVTGRICAYNNCDTCSADGTCASCLEPYSLSNGQCVSLQPNGALCSAASQCSSNICTGHVCCAYRNCQACAAAGGTCSACDVANYYLDSGRCFVLKVNGATCTGPNQCASGTCTDTVCCAYANCQTCAGGTCSACDPMNYYLSGGQCLALKVNGASCSGFNECSSGTCTSTVCCAFDNCRSCAGGTCSACFSGNYLSGNKCFALKATGASCSNSNECTSSICTRTVCCAYANCLECVGGACSACNTSTTYLKGSQCVALNPNGASCLADNECSSGICTDRVCCAYSNCQACVGGTCSSCDTAVSYLTHGQCVDLKVNGASCAAPNQCNSHICTGNVCCAYSNCRACVGGRCSACDPATAYLDAGQCLAPKPIGASCSLSSECGSGTCTEFVCCSYSNCRVCLGPGATCSDCFNGDVPILGQCLATKSNGASCSVDNECSSGICTGHVCCAYSNCQACVAGTCSACFGGDYLSGGQCFVLKANGAACSIFNECSSGTCTGNVCCAHSNCQACAGGTCSACADEGYLSGGQCLPLKSNGAACSNSTECETNICTGNVCCAYTNCKACVGGSCSACNPANYYLSGGQCLPLKSDNESCADPEECGSGTCTDTVCCAYSNCLVCAGGICSACDNATYYLRAGQCLAFKSNGATCSNPVECSSGTCTGNVCCAYSNCQACVAGTCSACNPAAYYPSSGQCLALKANGDVCSDANECTSKTCTGNVCCAYDNCQACANGTCSVCFGGDYLSGGRCFVLKDNGVSCSNPNECTSDTCTDDVCCAYTNCQECIGGTCSSCDTVSYYLSGEQCISLKAGGVICASNSECRSARCATYCCQFAGCDTCGPDGHCATCAAPTSYLNGTGYCIVPSTPGDSCVEDAQCTTFTCRLNKCCASWPCTECSTDGGECTGCPSTHYLDGSPATCVPKAADGASCTLRSSCYNGNCVGNVCCAYANCTTCDSDGCATCSPATEFLSNETKACLMKKTPGAACDSDIECATPSVCKNARCCKYIDCAACADPMGRCTDCSSAAYVNGSQQCAPKLVYGEVCTNNNMCLSAQCATAAGQCCRYSTCLTCSSIDGACLSCPSNQFLTAGGSCSVKQSDGTACNGNQSCTSNYCNTYCCTSQSCATCAQTTGKCVTCVSGWYMNSTSACELKKAFASTCTSPNDCLSGFCTTGSIQPRLCCANSGCSACDATTGACTACANTKYVTATGTCAVKKTNGSSCIGDAECQSATCTNNNTVCCAVGNCSACGTGGQDCTVCRPGFDLAMAPVGSLHQCLPKTASGQQCGSDADCFSVTCRLHVCCLYSNCTKCHVGNGTCSACPSAEQYIAADTGACRAPQANGSPCSAARECLSVQCIGHRCCAYANCQACDSWNGSCTDCALGKYVAADGQCWPQRTAGSACPGDSACLGGKCAAQVCCMYNATCAACSTTNGACTSCPSSHFLSGAGVCMPKSSKGGPCASHNECLSTQCIASHCCSVHVSSSCAGCDASGVKCTTCPQHSRLSRDELSCISNTPTLDQTSTASLLDTATVAVTETSSDSQSGNTASASKSYAATESSELTATVALTDTYSDSQSASKSDPSHSVTVSDPSVSASATQTLPLPPTPVPLDENMRTAVTVLESTTTVVGALASPAAALQMARVKGTMDMVKRCRGGEKQGDTEHLKQSSGFPSSFLPFLHVGSAEGQYMRGAVLANIVAVPVISAGVLTLGALVRASGKFENHVDKQSDLLFITPRSAFRSIAGTTRMPGSAMVVSSAAVYGLVSAASTLYDYRIYGALDLFLASVAAVFVLAVVVTSVAHLRRTVRDHVSYTHAIMRRPDGQPIGRLARPLSVLSGNTAWFPRDELVAVQAKNSASIDTNRGLEDHVALESWGLLIARYRGVVLTRRPTHHGPPTADSEEDDDSVPPSSSVGVCSRVKRCIGTCIQTAATFFFAIDFTVTCIVAMGEGLAATECSRGLAVSVVGNALGLVCAVAIRPYNASVKNVLLAAMNALLTLASFVTVGAIQAQSQADADRLAAIANKVAMAAAAMPFAAIVLTALRVVIVRVVLRAQTVPAIARRRVATTAADELSARMLDELQEMPAVSAGVSDNVSPRRVLQVPVSALHDVFDPLRLTDDDDDDGASHTVSIEDRPNESEQLLSPRPHSSASHVSPLPTAAYTSPVPLPSSSVTNDLDAVLSDLLGDDPHHAFVPRAAPLTLDDLLNATARDDFLYEAHMKHEMEALLSRRSAPGIRPNVRRDDTPDHALL
jgi:hypothetical protein